MHALAKDEIQNQTVRMHVCAWNGCLGTCMYAGCANVRIHEYTNIHYVYSCIRYAYSCVCMCSRESDCEYVRAYGMSCMVRVFVGVILLAMLLV